MAESLPLNETPEVRRSGSIRWLGLGLLVVAYLECDAFFSAAAAGTTLGYAFMLGFLVSQPMLLSFWTAFAPQRLYHRLLWGLALCVSVALAAELGHRIDPGFAPIRQTLPPMGFLLSIDLVLLLLATPLLLLLRRLSRWKLSHSASGPSPSRYQAHQFGLKHLFILTTITALVCGSFRTLAVFDPTLAPPPVAEVSSIVFQIGMLFLPMALIPWFTLGSPSNARMSMLFALLFLIVSEAACCFVFRTLPRPDALKSILAFQLGAGASVFLSTLVIRWCGFRMIREAKTLASP
jgi:hypothetical protein